MLVRLRVLVPGTRVRLRRPGSRERGTWVVGDRLVGSGPEDPAYELPRSAVAGCASRAAPGSG